MMYWYPTQQRVEALSRDLEGLEQSARTYGDSPQEFVPLISTALVQAERTNGFPTRQLARWIWIASQFRLHGGERSEIAIPARGALTFLIMRLARSSLSQSDVQDLNWVLDSTINKLSKLVGAKILRSCLSAEELSRIEHRLASYENSSIFDPNVLRSRIQKQIQNIDAIAKDANLNTVKFKIEALFAACERQGRESTVARAALLYLADIPDVIPDSQGVLGLLDDIYVIERAYAAVESQTRCLPLLDALLEKWPFVADIPFIGPSLAPLDRYSQYIACACLHSLFETDDHSLLVVRESSAHCIIAALMAAIESLRKEATAAQLDVVSWTTGQPITISDGTKTFKALYGGLTHVGSSQKLRIGVRDNGWITIDPKMLPYISRAPATHATLSKGNDISQWLKDHYVDPLIYLTGSSRRRLKQQKCILLVGPRNKLDEYLGCVNPLGSSMAALFGLQYVTAHHRFDGLNDTTTDTPCVYACSDASTALDLIREPPAHVEAWRVIVDGARTGRVLLDAISTEGELAGTSICVLAELHEREAASEIQKRNVSVWYLEDQHIEVPPLQPIRPDENSDALVRALTRQTNHWTVSRNLHVSKSEFLEQVSGAIKERTARGQGIQSETTALDLSLSAFLQLATARPIKLPELDKGIATLAHGIAMQASMLRQYDEQAGRLYSLFKNFVASELHSFDREKELKLIADTISSSETVAIVCRSAQIADLCRTHAQSGSQFANFHWMNVARLRQLAPFDRVIVPGWLDRMAMRELNENGYGSRLDLLFYPFEEKWFTSTVEASRKWERRLSAKTAVRLVALNKLFEDSKPQVLWASAPDAEKPSVVEDYLETVDEVSEIDQLEARAIEALRRTFGESRPGQTMAKAQLVLFEQAGSYAYLPPAGKVIVLARDAVLNEELLASGHAERMLFRNVSTLEPGMVLALPTGTDRDLIDARADQFLTDAVSTRHLAALWKDALKRHFFSERSDPPEFSRRLALAGQKREASTVKAWVSHTNTIAPSNFREVVPLIANLTDDVELKTKCNVVLQSIDLIYRARTRAAELIVRELFSGTIDIDEDELCFDLGGKKVSYLLRQVRRVEGIQNVPTDVIGKVGNLTTPHDFSDRPSSELAAWPE